MKVKKKYKQLWIASVDIEAAPEYEFNDLVDCSECDNTLPAYTGAWANIILQSETINEALILLEMGLSEKNFIVKFIDKIENLYSLVEDNDVNIDIIKEAEWLYSSKYRFMISDKLWPYSDNKPTSSRENHLR